jgi:hypothetical protein
VVGVVIAVEPDPCHLVARIRNTDSVGRIAEIERDKYTQTNDVPDRHIRSVPRRDVWRHEPEGIQ